MADDSREQLKIVSKKLSIFLLLLMRARIFRYITSFFVRGVNADFAITEELVEMRSMMSTTTGADIAAETIKGLENIGLGGAWGN